MLMWLLHLAFFAAVFHAASSQPSPSPSPSPRRFEKLPNGNSCASETMHMWRGCTRVGSLGGIFDGWCSGGAYYFPPLEQTILHRGPCKANAKRSEHEARYGPIAQWDVSDATDLNASPTRR